MGSTNDSCATQKNKSDPREACRRYLLRVSSITSSVSFAFSRSALIYTDLALLRYSVVISSSCYKISPSTASNMRKMFSCIYFKSRFFSALSRVSFCFYASRSLRSFSTALPNNCYYNPLGVMKKLSKDTNTMVYGVYDGFGSLVVMYSLKFRS